MVVRTVAVVIDPVKDAARRRLEILERKVQRLEREIADGYQMNR